jgi:hypothetical protein
VAMSGTELADRDGAFVAERAAHAVAAVSLRKATPLTRPCAFPTPPRLRIPFDNAILTALTCRRTFHDSAVKTALSRCRCSPGARGMTVPASVIHRGVLSMFPCRVMRAGLAVRATEFRQFIPSDALP